MSESQWVLSDSIRSGPLINFYRLVQNSCQRCSYYRFLGVNEVLPLFPLAKFCNSSKDYFNNDFSRLILLVFFFIVLVKFTLDLSFNTGIIFVGTGCCNSHRCKQIHLCKSSKLPAVLCLFAIG